jgi:putative DNA methylase
MTAAAFQLTLPPPRLAPMPKGQPRPGLCFIETQFPVSKMSKESYAERTAKQSQTLTGLGKWWGRKPLVLCRATILGLLLPATDNPVKDREVFLRLMTMDDDGMLRRKSANISPQELFRRLPPSERDRCFERGSKEDNARLKRSLSKPEKYELQRRVFLSLSYDERLEYCDRPEQVNGPSPESWQVINAHLGTDAASLPDLVAELGKRRFGHVPRVGDSFCGGGSIPFEAARIGCDAYGSDLNPVAAMLTWAALNIVGGGDKVAEEVHKAQRKVYDAVDRQVTAWEIEHREPDPKTGRRWRADAYLYCTEVKCPECGWRVPLSPTWVIGKGTRTIAHLIPDEKRKGYDFEIHSAVSSPQMAAAAEAGTAKNSQLLCPNPKCKARTPIKAIRGDGRGTFGKSKSLLRGWETSDLVPRPDDIFGERLYCVRWVDTWIGPEGKPMYERHYAATTALDLKREHKVLGLLKERLEDWQKKGLIPSRRIEPGDKTDEPIRTRGWTYWHHLFTPRQLLVHGLFSSEVAKLPQLTRIMGTLLLGRLANWDSRLTQWLTDGANEKTAATFANQAFNTLWNFGIRTVPSLDTTWLLPLSREVIHGNALVRPADAREVDVTCDLWITDPPYADAVKYEELGEYSLAWHENHQRAAFPEWYVDSRRALAVTGEDEPFLRAMVACYRRLADLMSDTGMQVVMFTHQDAGVWADLALILWAAGLRVSAAWCIATETGPAVGQGNYVQGTVLMVLRKQTSAEPVFLDAVYQDVEAEVRRQLDTMRDLDDAKDPNFGDTDYQLAAYAAALRVLTSKKIQEIDVAYELTRTRKKGEPSQVEDLIERAVKTACDHLVPKGINRHLWKSLSAPERFYLKGLETESHGEHRTGVYQELARGFGVEEYTQFLAATKANETRLKTATELARRDLSGGGFADSVVRHALFAAFKTAESEGTRDSITWLKTEVKDYAANRQGLIETLEFLSALRQVTTMPHWHKDAEAAGLLAGALRNRQDNV